LHHRFHHFLPFKVHHGGVPLFSLPSPSCPLWISVPPVCNGVSEFYALMPMLWPDLATSEQISWVFRNHLNPLLNYTPQPKTCFCQRINI
jgi:hypothetical protein